MSELAGVVGARFDHDGSVLVTEVTHDSRRVTEGSMYVALVGRNFDGHDYVVDAVSKGAVAVCVERTTKLAIPELVVDDTRAVLGDLSAAVYDHPSHALSVIGVTGTNGKTTVTHYIDSIAHQSGRVTGLMGTIRTRIAGDEVPASMTTPEASEFQRLLAAMRDAGVTLVSAEVSSHALEFGRVKATRFAVAAFTNLSQDHLDFHGDMESYRAAKERLFTEYEVGTAVFNIDDPVGAGLAAHYQGQQLTVGEGGDVSVHDVHLQSDGHTHFQLETPWGGADVSAPVMGTFNIANLALAVTCCVASGLDFGTVAQALPHVAGVPGRFEMVSGDDPIRVVVDYAHTPEAVVRAVDASRELTTGRVIALLGAGGDRDRAKRPAMGAALSAADLAIVTSDNPRSEDPDEIVAEVMRGVDEGREHLVEVDRRRAIDIAIDRAEDGDVVLILGRGHEPFQETAGQKVVFDDRVVAAEALRRRRKSARNDGGSGSISS
ncbi:MAG: UDP-N-acetylmuramoyl-L-alanyl-D-glutamate--2,6-diaminopimelate ligase [Acidimicrobiia bacterium]